MVYHYYAECRVVMLSVVMKCVVMLSVVMLSVVMLSVVLPSVVILSVVAPSKKFKHNFLILTEFYF
jgi:hypothetical protein